MRLRAAILIAGMITCTGAFAAAPPARPRPVPASAAETASALAARLQADIDTGFVGDRWDALSAAATAGIARAVRGGDRRGAAELELVLLRIHVSHDRNAEAREAYARAAALDSQSPGLRYAAGLLAKNAPAPDLAAAERSFRDAYVLEPAFRDRAAFQLALLFQAGNDPSRALEYARRSLAHGDFLPRLRVARDLAAELKDLATVRAYWDRMIASFTRGLGRPPEPGERVVLLNFTGMFHRSFGGDTSLRAADAARAIGAALPLAIYRSKSGALYLTELYQDSLQVGDAALAARALEALRALQVDPADVKTDTDRTVVGLREDVLVFAAAIASERTAIDAKVTADPAVLLADARSTLRADSSLAKARSGLVASALSSWLDRFGSAASTETRDEAWRLMARLVTRVLESEEELYDRGALDGLLAAAAPPIAEVQAAAGAWFDGLGRYEDAAERFGRAAELAPSSARLDRWAIALESANALEPARKAWSRALALDSNDSSAIVGLTRVLSNLGRIVEAEPMLRGALWNASHEVGEQRQIASLLVDVLRGLGRARDARALADELDRRHPTFPAGQSQAALQLGLARATGAEASIQLGDYDLACTTLASLAERIRASFPKADDDRRQKLESYVEVRLARCERYRGRADAASAALERARGAAETVKPVNRSLMLADVFDEVSSLAAELGDDAGARAATWDEYDLASARGEAATALDMAAKSRRAGLAAEAAGWDEIALDAAERGVAQRPSEDAELALAQVQRRRRDWTAAIASERRVVELATVRGARADALLALMRIGGDLESAGRFGDAKASYEQARDGFLELGLRPRAANAEVSLGSVLDDADQVDAARQAYGRALAIRRATGERAAEANALESLGYLESDVGRYGAADAAIDAALVLRRALGNPSEVSNVLGQRVLLRLLQGRTAEALADADAALAALGPGAGPLQRSYGLERRSRPRLAAGDLVGAEADAREAWALYSRLYPYRHRTIQARTLGTVLVAIARAAPEGSTERRTRLDEAVALLDAPVEPGFGGDTLPDWRRLFQLGQLHELRGAPEEALRYYRAAIDDIERRRRSTGGDDAAFLAHFRPVYVALLELLERLGRGTEMFDYAARMQAVEYRAGATVAGADGSGDGASQATLNGIGLSARLSELDALIEAARRVGRTDAGSGPGAARDAQASTANAAYLRALEETRGAVAVELAQVRREMDAVARNRMDVDPRTFASMQRDLPENAVLLQPALLSDRLVLLVYTRRQAFPVRVALETIDSGADAGPYTAERLRADVVRYLELARSPHADVRQVRALSERLYDALIRPVERELDGRQVLIVSPLGVLRQVPYASLRDRVSGRYLIERLPIVNVARRIPLERAARERTDRRLLALVVPEDGLPATQTEGAAIAQSFPSSRVLVGASARSTALRWEAPDRFDAVVFATHARFDEQEQYVELAGGEKLSPEALTRYAANWQTVELVVMSACETAAFTQDQASPFDSLVGVIEDLSIPTVIGTQWRVNDEYAARVMATFYARLKAGDGVAEALRQGQIAALADAPDRPYLWAPFQVYGDWR